MGPPQADALEEGRRCMGPPQADALEEGRRCRRGRCDSLGFGVPEHLALDRLFVSADGRTKSYGQRSRSSGD
jgi:hypothetical protein